MERQAQTAASVLVTLDGKKWFLDLLLAVAVLFSAAWWCTTIKECGRASNHRINAVLIFHQFPRA
jgi:hypothetical protein